MKHIHLNLEDKEFLKLANLKSRVEMMQGDTMTWEEFILLIKNKFERI
jgi:hypothetical protein